jgi:hypothetical protein
MLTIATIVSLFAHGETRPDFITNALSVLANKRKMPDRYSITFREEASLSNAPQGVESRWTAMLRIWHEGNKHRVDHYDAEYTPQRPGHIRGLRHVACINCERDHHAVITQILPQTAPNAASHAVEVRPYRNIKEVDYYNSYFDWRFFGMMNAGRVVYTDRNAVADYESFLRRPKLTFSQKLRDASPGILAEFKANTNEASVWMSEQHEYNPVYFRFSATHNNKPILRSTEVAWQKIEGGYWFPKTVKNNSSVTIGVNDCQLEESITILHVDFHNPIDPSVFTFSGLGIHDGQPLSRPNVTTLDMPIWRNGTFDPSDTVRNRELEQQNASTSSEPPPPPAYPTRSNTPLVMAAITGGLSILLAIVAVVVHRRRRESA